jgi:hypothetical protein
MLAHSPSRINPVAKQSLSFAPGRLRSKFSIEEDEQLKGAVAEAPEKPWSEIANMFPGKTPRQVRERFKNYLCPTLNHAVWTPEEDSLLCEKFAIFGPKWRVLKRFFVNRSDVNVKNRWSVLASKANRNSWDCTGAINMHPVQASIALPMPAVDTQDARPPPPAPAPKAEGSSCPPLMLDFNLFGSCDNQLCDRCSSERQWTLF